MFPVREKVAAKAAHVNLMSAENMAPFHAPTKFPMEWRYVEMCPARQMVVQKAPKPGLYGTMLPAQASMRLRR